MTFRDRIADLLLRAPAEADAIEFDGAWWTWGDLQRVAGELGSILDAAGLPVPSRIGVLLENRPEHAAVVAALGAAGHCLVTLSSLQPAERLAADVTRSDVPVLIGSAEAWSRAGVRSAAEAHGLTVQIAPDGSCTVLGGAPTAATPATPGVAIEMLTSGTTGPPKRVHLRDSQLDEGLESSGQVPGEGVLLSKGVGLVSTPIVHIGGLWGLIAGLQAGRRLVLLTKFSVEPWVSAVERHRIRAAGLVPAALRSVLDADIAPERLARLEVVLSGTAPCPADLADAFFRRFGARVLMTYGATEFAGAVAGWTLPLHEQWWATKAGSAGRPFPGVELRVVDAQGRPVATGVSGHLEVRSRMVSADGSGWVRTSDLARLDGDGFLWIDGRADDAIIRGGFKIHPDAVRKVLELHPSVQEAAVAGLPDTRLGQLPVAAVELRPGAAVPTSEELVALCREHLTPYEVPAQVVVLDELPRTPSSKVSRVDLLEVIQERIAGQPAR